MAIARFPSWGWFSGLFTNPERGVQKAEPSNQTTEANIVVTDERSLMVPVVFSCIRLISEIVGVLPLHVYKRLEKGRQRDDEHPIARLIEEPNPLMTAQEFKEAVALQIAGWGNSYSRVDRNSEGVPQFLWPLVPSKMQPERKGFDGIEYKYSHDAIEQTTYPQERILHFKGFGSDGVMGLSPLGYARQALGVQIAAEQYAASFYKSGGKASSIYTPDKPFTSDQRDNFQKWLNEIAKSQGSGVWALPVPGKWHDVSIPPEDAQMLVTRQFQIGEIARIFRIPLFLLMEMEKSTSWGTGLEQQNLAFLTYTVAPYIKRIESVMNRRLFTDAERKTHYVEFNVDALLRTDSKTRAEVHSIRVQNGLLSRNESRAQDNLEPFAGGDEYTAQTNLAPVDKLAEIAAKPAPAPAQDAGKSLQPVILQVDAMQDVAAGMKAVAGAVEGTNRTHKEIITAVDAFASDAKELPKALKAAQKASESVSAGLESVKRGEAEIARVMGEMAKETARSNAATVTALKDGMMAVVKEVARPRRVVLDKDGNPLGTEPVDKL